MAYWPRMLRVNVRVFGGFAVSVAPETGRLVQFESAKTRALLAYLVMEADRSHSRATLCGLLWPEMPEKSARNNLSQALGNIREVLGLAQDGVPLLRITLEGVMLAPDVPLTCDAHDFLALIEDSNRHAHRAWRLCSPCIGRLSAAVALYAGDFLSDGASTAPFEEWARGWRELLRQRYTTALTRLADADEWRANLPGAIGHLRQLIQTDPLDEPAHRELIRLLALNGERSAARQQAAHLARALADAGLGETDQATQQLVRALNGAGDAVFVRYSQPALQRAASSALAAPHTLIGRDAVLRAITDTLCGAGARLLTLKGAPGVGKTRLALEAAHELRFGFEHGVVFVELAPLTDASEVPYAVARALALVDQPGAAIDELLIQHLRDKHVLLVLDNMEHVLDAAGYVAALIAACPDLRCLITSREALRVRPEQVLELPPLPVPQSSEVHAVQQTASACFFVSRVRAVAPSFELHADNAADVARICARLDGLPLALELFAARADLQSPSQIAADIDFAMLDRDGPRDLPERQRTLRAAISWSVQRLDASARECFIQLSVFAGGFAEHDAAAVAGLSAAVRDVLLRASLLQHAQVGRLRMLEPIREYALEMLMQAGQAYETRQQHAHYFAGFCVQAFDALIGPEQAAWHARIDVEQPNIQAAIRWSLQDSADRGEQALKIGYGIWRYWWQRGFWRDNLALMRQALALNGPDVSAIVRQADAATVTPRLLLHAGAARGTSYLAAGLNQYDDAMALLSHALQCAMQAEDDVMVARTYSGLGMVAKDAGDFDAALAFLEDGLRLWQRTDPAQLRFPQVLKASVLMRMGDVEVARALYAIVLDACERAQDTEGTATALRGLAEAAWRQGAPGEAASLLERAIALCDGIGNKRGNAWAYHQMGNALRASGDFAAARAWLARSLTETRAFGDQAACLEILVSMAELDADCGDAMSAARTLATVAASIRQTRVSLTAFEQAAIARCRQRCRAALSAADYARAEQEGALLTP